MSALVNTETGEIVEPITRDEAERLSMKIGLRLDSIADNYTAVMPMIREAIERGAHVALGYRSPGDYLSDRFGGALSRLGMDVRREVVRELTAAGLSTRAIAPVVGASKSQVAEDARVQSWTPEPAADPAPVSDVAPAPEPAPSPPPPVVGIDGKTYIRRDPAPAPSEPSPPRESTAPRRRPLPDQARDAGWDLRKAVERLERIAADDRFSANKDQMASLLRGHLTAAVESCQGLLDRIDS